MKYRTAFPLALILLWGGCSSTLPSPSQRYSTLSTLAGEHNLSLEPITTSHFSLMSISSVERCHESKNMHIYIEGDGLAWKTKTQLSKDPTPLNPLSAKLMFIDRSLCKVYLARPCQYTNDAQCTSNDWSSHRFSPKVIDSYQEVLNILTKKYGVESFTLVGYSGGGAVALLIAANRDDIKKIITLAGNLDTDAWVKYHGLNPLNGSLNPADYAKKLNMIEQLHLIGKEDSIIPKYVFDSYIQQSESNGSIRSKIMDSDHSNNWEVIYKKLLDEMPI